MLNFPTEGVPAGAVVMWSGALANIPKGWALCDGANGTPDLRDSFVVGAGNSYAKGDTGGSKDAVAVAHSHTGSTSTDGYHGHSGNTDYDGSHNHRSGTKVTEDSSTISDAYAHFGANGSGGSYRADSSAGTYGSYRFALTDTEGNHRHGLNINGNGSHNHSLNINSAGEDGTDKNLPPYVALAYIMKL